MKLKNLELKTIESNFQIYIEFYSKVVENLPDKSWLGLFNEDKIKDVLNNDGKIWIWTNKKEIVCSLMYINATKDALDKLLLIDYKVNEVGECGAVLVNEKYWGNGLQLQMLDFLENYANKINKKYILTTVHPDNVYSIDNFKNKNYLFKNTFDLHRGKRNLYIKEL